MNYLAQAIQALRPTAEFVILNDDYSQITWHVLEGDAPSLKEVEAEIMKIKSGETAKAKADEIAKAALLERLGITADEVALLLA